MTVHYEKCIPGLYIKDNINYEREKNIEIKYESVISIKVGLPGKRKISIIAYYRQWKILYKNNEKKYKYRYYKA